METYLKPMFQRRFYGSIEDYDEEEEDEFYDE